MKKLFSVLLVCVITASALSACSLIPGFGRPKNTPAPTAAPAVTEAPAVTAAPAATEAPIGSLSDYVQIAKKASFTFEDGTTRTYQLPEIELSSADAAAANTEIMDRFGDDVKEYTDYSPVVSLDYEAYLNDQFLSVIVTGKYDGGNSYGLCYTFDVTNGSELNSVTLCSMLGRDYNDAINKLTENLTAYYDEKYGAMPGNDTERAKTLDSANISAAKMYLDGNGFLTALVDIYAAVGGGHWVDSVSAQ